jgi:opacity protein-like surface antigen
MCSIAACNKVTGKSAGSRVSSLFLACVLGLAGVASAQTAAPTSGWQYEITPYFWGAGMKGDMQGGALPKISTDVSISDIMKVLDFGMMGAFEARKGRWGLLFDAIYMDLSAGGAASRTGPGPIGATATANANFGMKQTVLGAAVAYRTVEGRSPVDVFGGLRYIKLEADADIHGSFFARAGTVARSADQDWVDPYVGARIKHAVNDRWSLTGNGDIGGFGLGSDISWQLSAGAGYDFTKSVSGIFGYRIFYADYDKSGFLYDMKSEGFYAGVGIRF